MKYEMVGIPASEVDAIWPSVLPLLQDAIDKVGSWACTDDLLNAIQERDAQLWIIKHGEIIVAAGMTEIIAAKHAKALNIIWAAGHHMGEWIGIGLRTFEDFARAHDCRQITMLGRRGWLKVLDNYGWQESVIKMTKEL